MALFIYGHYLKNLTLVNAINIVFDFYIKTKKASPLPTAKDMFDWPILIISNKT